MEGEKNIRGQRKMWKEEWDGNKSKGETNKGIISYLSETSDIKTIPHALVRFYLLVQVELACPA